MKPPVTTYAIIAMLGALTLPLNAQEWSRFRGPNGEGQALGHGNFKQLTSKNLAWKTPLPGKGHSSPVNWGRQIFLTSTDEKTSQFTTLSIDSDSGKILWNQAFPYQTFKKHKFNSYASSTATADEDRVYVSWGTPDHLYLAALNHSGDLQWKRDLGSFKSQHGPGTSPILFEDLVILTNEQLGDSFIIGVDQKTGETRWKSPRRTAKTAYSTPCLSEDATGKPILLVNSQAHGIGALNPKTGVPLWEYTGAFDKRSCSSPIAVGGLVFGSCGSGGGGNFVVAVKPPNGTTRKSAELAYEIRRSAPYVPCFIANGEWLFLWSDGGILSCVEPQSGKVQWSERTRGRFFGSPIAVDDQLIAVGDTGKIQVVSGTGKFEMFGSFDLKETCHSTPALIDNHLFVRTVSNLWKFKPAGH